MASGLGTGLVNLLRAVHVAIVQCIVARLAGVQIQATYLQCKQLSTTRGTTGHLLVYTCTCVVVCSSVQLGIHVYMCSGV